MFETISPFFLFAFIFLITAGEFFLSASWMPFFFRFGIPLMRKEFKMLTAVSSLEEYIGPLESQLPRSWQQPSIAFKALGSDELAFRQKFGQRSPAHGHVVYDRMRQKLLFTGYLPWSTLITPFMFVFILLWAPFEAVFMFLFVFMVILGFGILMAYRNYGRIAQVVEETLQEQIATDSILAPDLQTPHYEPDLYEKTNYDPYLPTSQQKSTNNSSQIMLIAVLIGVGAVMILVSVITFLLLAG